MNHYCDKNLQHLSKMFHSVCLPFCFYFFWVSCILEVYYPNLRGTEVAILCCLVRLNPAVTFPPVSNWLVFAYFSKMMNYVTGPAKPKTINFAVKQKLVVNTNFNTIITLNPLLIIWFIAYFILKKISINSILIWNLTFINTWRSCIGWESWKNGGRFLHCLDVQAYTSTFTRRIWFLFLKI